MRPEPGAPLPSPRGPLSPCPCPCPALTAARPPAAAMTHFGFESDLHTLLRLDAPIPNAPPARWQRKARDGPAPAGPAPAAPGPATLSPMKPSNRAHGAGRTPGRTPGRCGGRAGRERCPPGPTRAGGRELCRGRACPGPARGGSEPPAPRCPQPALVGPGWAGRAAERWFPAGRVWPPPRGSRLRPRPAWSSLAGPIPPERGARLGPEAPGSLPRERALGRCQLDAALALDAGKSASKTQSTPAKAGGDRYIPHRSAMQMEVANFLLTKENDDAEDTPTKKVSGARQPGWVPARVTRLEGAPQVWPCPVGLGPCPAWCPLWPQDTAR